jgi:type I restriction enzyme S subunit
LQYGIESVRGVSIDKKLIDTKADMSGVSLKPYYIVKPDEFAYVTVTSRNGEKISLAMNDTDKTYICSSSYVVFRSKDKDVLLPQYLMLFFTHQSLIGMHDLILGEVPVRLLVGQICVMFKIPIPDISVQKAIADIYTAYSEMKKINERLKAQIKDLCPILIKGSIEEARKGA